MPNTAEQSKELQVYSNQQAPAILVIIAPNREMPLGTFAHRPAVFNFNDTFIQNVSETLRESRETATDTPLKRFFKSPEYRHAIIPAHRPDCSVNLTPYGEKWRFVLVLKNPPRHVANSHIPTSNPNLVDTKVTLSGYFEGEPVSVNGHINHGAVLKIMHKSIQYQQNQHSPIGMLKHGQEKMVYHTQVIDSSLPHFTQTNQPLHLLTLSACHNNLDKGNGGQFGYSPSAAQQIGTPDNYGEEGGLILDYKNSDPYSSLKRMICNFHNSQMDTIEAHHDGMQYSLEKKKNDLKTAIDSLMPSDQRVRQGTNQSMIGYHENQYITLADIDRDYNVKVHVINHHNVGGVDCVDQQAANMRNVFGSLIHETLISKMSKYGIGHLDFKYQSLFEKMDSDMSLVNPYVVDFVTPPEMLYECTPEEAYQKANTLVHELSQEVFKSMGETNGDFQLNVSADLAQCSYIQLNFLCDNQFIYEPLMYPTYFSGLITQKWGTGEYARINNENYSNWIDSFTTNYAYGNTADVWERGDTAEIPTHSNQWQPTYQVPTWN